MRRAATYLYAVFARAMGMTYWSINPADETIML